MDEAARVRGANAVGRDPLATATHARLRAAQGDLEGARRILRDRLAREPCDREARRLLRSLGGEPSPGPRLRRWLADLEAGIVAPTEGVTMMLEAALDRLRRSIPGARFVLLVGRDGMIVAGGLADGADSAEWLAAGYADLVRRAAAANRDAGLDEPGELEIGAGDCTVLYRRVSGEYGLLTVLGPRSGPVGRARYELRKAAVEVAPQVQG